MTQDRFQAQKYLAAQLDRAANRADMAGGEPATSKQCWYLAGLMLRSGDDGSEWTLSSTSSLTKRHASRLIDELARETV